MSSDDRTRAEDVMSTPLRTISPKATVADAARAMRENEISALVVTSPTPSIVTSTDVLDAVAEGSDPDELQVADVMTPSIQTVPPDLPLGEVAAMMTSLGIKHLPVVDGDPIGMVSSTDIAAQLS